MIPRDKLTLTTTTTTICSTIGKQFSFLLLASVILVEEKHWLTIWFPKTFQIIHRQQQQKKNSWKYLACSQSSTLCSERYKTEQPCVSVPPQKFGFGFVHLKPTLITTLV